MHIRHSPIQVQFLGQELPVLALGICSVKGGADPLADGRGDFKGLGPYLGRDGAVCLHKNWNGLLFSLEKHNKNGQ